MLTSAGAAEKLNNYGVICKRILLTPCHMKKAKNRRENHFPF